MTKTDDDSQLETDNDIMKTMANFQKSANLRTIYSVVLTLRECVHNNQANWYNQWPPLSSDMTRNNVKTVVPPLLFNFIAWMLKPCSHYAN